MNFPSIAQTVEETEPNDNIFESGVITISSIGDYTGSVSVIDYISDRDLWILSHGSTSIDLKFSTTVYNWDIVFILECYTDASYSNRESYQIWNGGDNPSLINLNPERYYVFKVFNNNNDYDNTLTYTITVEDGVLPVELISFTANVVNNTVELNWQTATEVNNYGFNVERSWTSSAPLWEKIGFVQGYGNSNSPKSYSFEDINPQYGKLQYRLKQIDFDGKFEYSDVVEVAVAAPAKFELMQNYPNPFNPSTTISYTIPNVETLHGVSLQHVTLKVYDLLGREVAVLVNELQQAGAYIVQLSTNIYPLSSGIYFYKLTAGSFSAAKKFLLLK
jgi:hypothetical protein